MNILAFDIEDWFHIMDHPSTRNEAQWSNFESRLEGNVERILEMLIMRRQKAVFFCLGWIAAKFPYVIRKISDAGYEVASHSYAHQLVYEQSPRQFERDLDKSIRTIQDATGNRVRAYRAPGFSITQDTRWAFDILAGLGIQIDCSVFPAGRIHGGYRDFGSSVPCKICVADTHIKEFPINYFPFMGKRVIFSGGGYFRLLPYSIIKSLMVRAPYVMTYFHPRDFDLNQPMIKDLPLDRKFRSYIGIHGAFHKLQRLLDDFSFLDLDTALVSIDWDSAPVIVIRKENRDPKSDLQERSGG
jgi:polysaccharide deacetylase family protein (PEP-CTERM system associated)